MGRDLSFCSWSRGFFSGGGGDFLKVRVEIKSNMIDTGSISVIRPYKNQMRPKIQGMLCPKLLQRGSRRMYTAWMTKQQMHVMSTLSSCGL
jgi:hypothetical protein